MLCTYWLCPKSHGYAQVRQQAAEQTPSLAEALFSDIDTDGNGSISFMEFRKWWTDAERKVRNDDDAAAAQLVRVNTTMSTECQRKFAEYDKDGNNALDLPELTTLLTELDTTHPEFVSDLHERLKAAAQLAQQGQVKAAALQAAEHAKAEEEREKARRNKSLVLALFSEIDINGDNSISFVEFTTWWNKPEQSNENATTSPRTYPRSNNSSSTYETLKLCQRKFTEYDTDGNNSIDRAELAAVMTDVEASHPSFIAALRERLERNEEVAAAKANAVAATYEPFLLTQSFDSSSGAHGDGSSGAANSDSDGEAPSTEALRFARWLCVASDSESDIGAVDGDVSTATADSVNKSQDLSSMRLSMMTESFTKQQEEYHLCQPFAAPSFSELFLNSPMRSIIPLLS